MGSKLSMSFMAVALLASPVVALAQSNPTGNLGSNRSATAVPGTPTADTRPGLTTADVGHHVKKPMHSAMAKNPRVAGATGSTVVPGSNSTVTGDNGATTAAKTGVTGQANGGK